jgi:hypothetical protein
MTGMTSAARTGFALRPGAIHRGFVAGTVWGVATAAGLLGLTASTEGFVCTPDVVATTGSALLLGWLTIGPFVALAPSRRTKG